MKALAIIPARGGSKGIPNKNIVDFMGKPLIAHTIEAALESKCFDRVVVSTDSEEIAEIARKFGAEVPFLRPSELSGDTAGAVGVVTHSLNFYRNNLGYSPDYIFYLQPTSPLRNGRHIKEAASIMANSLSADSLVSVVAVPHNMIPESIMIEKDGYLEHFIEPSSVPLRQNKKSYVARNGAAIYIIKSKLVPQLSKSILGGKIIAYTMDRFHSIDVDEAEDLVIAELFSNYLKQGGFSEY